ncbi:MAG: right-handed parallel beta-helix repeat-containing protein [Paludibacter sp.]
MKTHHAKFIYIILLQFAFSQTKLMAALPDLGWGPTINTGANLYVATIGDDNADGSINKPWKTIAKAQVYIRNLKSGAGLPANGVTVWLRGGRYELASTLAFTAADNGTPDKPIIYRAYNNESVSVFNGKIIQPELWKPLSKDARKRVHPKVKADDLRELDISSLGVKNASILPDKFINWTLFDFVVDDARQPIAQWPNQSENIRGVNEPGSTTCNGSKDVVSFYYAFGGNPTDKDVTNEVDMDGTNRIERWKKSIENGHDLWLKGFWRIPWEAYTVKIAEINSLENWIKLAVNANQGMGSKYSPAADEAKTYRVGDGKEKWSAINYLDEIDQPGEWAYDFKDKKIYYLPAKNLNKVTAYIADKSQAIITLNGVSNIQFIGITVEGSQGNGFDLTNSSNISVAGCTIRNVGTSGISENNGKNNTFQSNNIFETGGVGINILNTGNRASLTPANDKVLNNHIHHTGKLTYLYGVFVKNSIGITFANNLIHDIPAGGFSTLLINNCTFEYNEIHNVALKVSDMGAYYGYGGWTCYGNEIRYNFVHHLNRANGLYSDDGTSGKNFHHNIVQGAIKPFLFGGGHQNIGKNNLIIECSSSASVDDRGIARKYNISNNYGKAVRDMKPESEPWKSYGKQLMTTYGYASTDSLWKATLDTLWHAEYPNGCKLIDNVEVQAKGFSKSKNGTVTISDNISIPKIADAGFKDYLNLDLQTTNAQIISKFPDLNIALPKIGLQVDVYRTSVVTRAETGGLFNRGAAGDKAYEDAVNR